MQSVTDQSAKIPEVSEIKPNEAEDSRKQAESTGRCDRNENEMSEVRTFFTVMDHKFTELDIASDSKIPTAAFLNCCRSIIPIFDVLGSVAFKPVKMDIQGNINKLHQKHSTNPESFNLLQDMIQQEIDSSTTTVKNSSTDALLWLKRALEFIYEFLNETMRNKKLSQAANTAYEKTLKPYHGFIVKGIFAVTLRAIPDYETFIVALAPTKQDAAHESYEKRLFEDAEKHLSSMKNVLDIINEFYNLNNLDNKQKV